MLAGSKVALERVHVRGHHGDASEHDPEIQRNGEGDQVKTTNANQTIVYGWNEAGDGVLVVEQSSPFRIRATSNLVAG